MEQESACPCALAQLSTGSKARIILRAFTVASWTLAVVATKPTLWEPSHLPASVFTMDSTMLDIFWIVLIAMQAAYICYTSLSMAQLIAISVLLEVHFIASNLLHTIFATLLSRSDFVFAEVVLLINFLNLLTLYYSSLDVPKFHQASIISGPLSWTIVAIYWNGSMMVPQPESLIAGILGIICTCGILATGIFYAIQYYDYTMTFCLSLLSSAVAVGQYHLMDTDIPSQHSMQFMVLLVQCIFAFVIMAALFVLTGAMAIADLLRYRSKKKYSHSGDEEKPVSDLERREKYEE